ncbi:MAG: phage tail tape measure protein [Pirellulales bacterium]
MAGKSGAIRAGRAFVEIFADKSRLVRDLKGTGKWFRDWGAGISVVGARIAGIGTLVAASFAAMALKAGDVGGELVDTSVQTGVAVEQLSTLRFAAKQCGVESVALTAAIVKMNKTIDDAGRGSKSAADALARIGLSIKDLKGLPPDEQFKRIATALGNTQNAGKRASAAMAIFGKSGAALIPLLSGGAHAIEQMQAEARRLGIEMATEDAEAADRFGDAIDALKMQISALVVRIGGALAPTLGGLVSSLQNVGARAGEWLRENAALVQLAFAGGAALLAMGAAVSVLGFALSGVGVVISATGFALAFVGRMLAASRVAFLALLSPMGLTIAAVTAVGAAVVAQSGVGRTALAGLAKGFSDVKRDAVNAWDGIKAALQSGDIGTALKIGLSFLKLEWVRGVGFLRGTWTDFWTWNQNVSTTAWEAIALGCSAGLHLLETVFYGTILGFQTAWAELATFLQNTWIKSLGWLAEKWAKFTAWLDGETADSQIAKIRAETAVEVAKNDAAKEDEIKNSFGRRGLDEADRSAHAREQSIRDDAAATIGGRNAARDATWREIDAATADAQKQLAELVDAAKAAGGRHIPESMRKRIEEVDVETTPGKTAGTFSGSLAAQMLGMGRSDDAVAKNTAATVKAVGALAAEVRKIAPSFA